VEDVEALVDGEERVRQPRSLVVPGHEEHGDPARGHPLERRQGSLGEPGRHAAPVVEVASVQDGVHLARERGREGELEVAEEVLSAAPALDPRPRGEVDAEVRVRDEEEPHRRRSSAPP
jgi:hypothetical protein